MKRISSMIAVAITLGGLVLGLVAGAGPAAATAAPYCGITWGSAEKVVDTYSGALLLDARTGRHPCFDRVVFEFSGAVSGYRVGYGEVYTGGEGLPLSPYTAGGALLGVELLGPAYDGSGASTYPRRLGEHVANVVRYQTLRDVVYAGSYEGSTTFAVGVRARLPFQVTVLAGPGSHGRIVLDVAHSWVE